MKSFNQLFEGKKPVIGMIHLPPLPGYERHPGMEEVIKKAALDLEVLQKAGFSGALVENDNDQPHQLRVKPEIKSAFKLVMGELMRKTRIPVGMEIIYDMKATVEVASELNCAFVRLDVFADDVETQWGKISESCEIVKDLLKYKKNQPLLLTDVHVKHARILSDRSLEQSISRSIAYGSHGVIITGTWTGIEPDVKDLQTASAVAGTIPVIVGSGLSVLNVVKLLPLCGGVIVGTSIKTGEKVDLSKARELIKVVKGVQ